MTTRPSIYIACVIIAILSSIYVSAQLPRNLPPGVPPIRPRTDTTAEKLEHRNPLEDSITISYHYFDSTRPHKIDSSISDFFTRFPCTVLLCRPGKFWQCCNFIIIHSLHEAGSTQGFHSYDIYKYTAENTRHVSQQQDHTRTRLMLWKQIGAIYQSITTQNQEQRQCECCFRVQV